MPPRHAVEPASRRRLLISLGLVLVTTIVLAVVVGRAYSAQLTSATGITPDVPPSATPLPLPPAIPLGPTSSAPRVTTSQAATPAAERVDLSGWASQLGVALGIPPAALSAYGQAELALVEMAPRCKLSWATLAGVGWVESDHGRYDGASLGPDGRSTPPIIGVALDGGAGIGEVPDTDDGRLDGDATLDRAVGPLQFIPSTWATWASDGDGDRVVDPFDIDDAALAAARYLCAAGGDLSSSAGWTAAIYAYNASDSYVVSVRAVANQYAELSLAVRPAG